MPTANDRTDQLTARQLLQPVLRRWWLILLSVAVVTGGVYAYEARQPELYQTSTMVFVKGSELAAALGGSDVYVDDVRNTANQATLLQSVEVARDVARRIDYQGQPSDLLGLVSATPEEGRDFIAITAQGASPQQARDVANGFAEAFVELRSSEARDRIRRALDAAERELEATPGTTANRENRAALRSRIRQLNAVVGLPAGTAEQVDPAPLPRAAIEPRPKRAAVFGFVLSLVLAIAAAYGLERLDRRLKLIEDIEQAYRKPVVGLIPRSSDVAPVNDGVPDMAPALREAFRSLRVNVDLAAIDRELRVLTVVSSIPEEGKSTVVRNLALAYAEAGLKVAVVESDLRKPMLSRTLNVEPRPGVTDVLAGEATLDQAMKPVRTGALAPAGVIRDSPSGEAVGPRAGSITLLTSGPEPPNPPVLLSSDPFQEILSELASTFDHVLLDTAPLLVIADAVPLLELADGVLVVTRFNRTTRDAAKRLTAVLDRVPDINVLGVVANEVPAREMSSGAYSYYGYGSNGKG